MNHIHVRHVHALHVDLRTSRPPPRVRANGVWHVQVCSWWSATLATCNVSATTTFTEEEVASLPSRVRHWEAKSPYYDFVRFQTKLVSTPFLSPILNWLRLETNYEPMIWSLTPKTYFILINSETKSVFCTTVLVSNNLFIYIMNSVLASLLNSMFLSLLYADHVDCCS